MPIDRSIANPFVAGGDVPQIMNYLNQQKQQQVENALRSKQQEMQDRAFAADDERNRFMDKRLVQADQAAIQQQEAAQAKLKQEEYSQFVTNGAQLLKRVADTQPQVFDTVKQRMAEELRTRFSDMPQPDINNVTPQSVQEFLAQVSASTGAGVDATLSPQEQFAQSQQAQLENLRSTNTISEQGNAASLARRNAKAGAGKFGAPRDGINPQTGQPDKFIVDQYGNTRWLGTGNVASANAYGREIGKSSAEAQMRLPQVEQTASTMLATLDKLADPDTLGWAYGWTGRAPSIPNTKQADAISIINQVQGQAFLQAFETLKGGGQITETEGAKATAAITRLADPNITEASAKEAIEELRGIINRSVMNARIKAEMANQAGGAAPPYANPQIQQYQPQQNAAPQQQQGGVLQYVPGQGWK